MTHSDRLCSFYLSGLLFGLPIEEVQEVLRHQVTTRVPLAAPEVAGLINLRGQIVTAIDMRTRMGFEPRPDGEHPMNVVLTPEHGSVSLLVDQIGEVLEVNEQTFEPPPPTIDPNVRGLIHGVYKLGGRLLLLLEAGRATALPGVSDESN